MEFSPGQVQIYLIFGTVMFLFADIASCEHKDIFPERYITEPYFEKHDSLVDSEFQDFLAHEVSLGLCEALQDKINPAPKLSIPNRRLIGEGSHRRLSTSVHFDVRQGSNFKLPDHYCEAIIIEKLPSGVFADPFELDDLLHRDVYKEVSVFGDTNLELPSIQSNRSLVEIHMDVGLNALSGSKNGLAIHIELPIHARYPPLGERGYSRIEFGHPDLLTHCIVKGKSHNQSCIFMSASRAVEAMGDYTMWEVPSGNKKHAAIVSFFTFISAILSALSIVFVSICNSNYQTDDKKQS